MKEFPPEELQKQRQTILQKEQGELAYHLHGDHQDAGEDQAILDFPEQATHNTINTLMLELADRFRKIEYWCVQT